MIKRLTDEDLAELEHVCKSWATLRAGDSFVYVAASVFGGLASLLAEVRESRAFKAQVAGYRKRLAAAIDEAYCDNNGYPSHVHELADGIKNGELDFDAAIFGEPEGDAT